MFPLPDGPAIGPLTDCSGTITAGGTAQTLVAANTGRQYLFIQNVDASEDLWFNYTTAATADKPSIRLAPRESYESSGGFVSTELVSVIAATTGHKYTAKEG